MKKFLSYALVLVALSSYAEQKPNFLLIYTDDQGYQDLGIMGVKDIKTPNIDALAGEGLIGTSFYVSASLCTPSRAALQTGKYHFNIDLYTKEDHKQVYLPYTKTGMPQEEITIAEVLQPLGYKTALIGKWHLGHLDEYLPTAQGYQHFYGIPFSHDLWLPENMKFSKNLKLNEGFTAIPEKPYEKRSIQALRDYKVPLMLNNEVIEYPAENNLLTEKFATETIRFIDESKSENKAFYICLATNMPHVPAEGSEKFKGSSQRGGYGDAVQELDHHIGRIIAHLKEVGLFENTFIVFASDNGPRMGSAKLGSAKPLKGGKGSESEGGHRVPFVLTYPKLVKAGIKTDEIMANIDLLPTIAELAGAEIPEGIDGVSLAKFLSGETDKSPRTEFLYSPSGYASQSLAAIRVDNWKLLKGKGGFVLYDLDKDIGEKDNIINKSPEKAQELIAIYNERLAEFNATNKSPKSAAPAGKRKK